MRTKTYRVEEKAVTEDIVEYKVSEPGSSVLGLALKAIFYPVFCVAVIIGFLAWIKVGAQDSLKSSRFATPEQMYEVFKDASIYITYDTTWEEAYKASEDINTHSRFLLLSQEERVDCQTKVQNYDRELCRKIRFVEDCLTKYFDVVQNTKKIKEYFSDEAKYNELLADMQQACDYINNEIGFYLYYRDEEDYYSIMGFSSENTDTYVKQYLNELWGMMNFMKSCYDRASKRSDYDYYKTKILEMYSGACSVQYSLHMARLRMLSMVQLPYTAY